MKNHVLLRDSEDFPLGLKNCYFEIEKRKRNSIDDSKDKHMSSNLQNDRCMSNNLFCLGV